MEAGRSPLQPGVQAGILKPRSGCRAVGSRWWCRQGKEGFWKALRPLLLSSRSQLSPHVLRGPWPAERPTVTSRGLGTNPSMQVWGLGSPAGLHGVRVGSLHCLFGDGGEPRTRADPGPASGLPGLVHAGEGRREGRREKSERRQADTQVGQTTRSPGGSIPALPTSRAPKGKCSMSKV